MGSVKVNHIIACLLGSSGCLTKVSDEFLDFIDGHLPWHIFIGEFTTNQRGYYRLETGYDCCCLPTSMSKMFRIGKSQTKPELVDRILKGWILQKSH